MSLYRHQAAEGDTVHHIYCDDSSPLKYTAHSSEHSRLVVFQLFGLLVLKSSTRVETSLQSRS